MDLAEPAAMFGFMSEANRPIRLRLSQEDGPAYPDGSSKVPLAIAEGTTDAERAKWRGWGRSWARAPVAFLSLLEKIMAWCLIQPAKAKSLL